MKRLASLLVVCSLSANPIMAEDAEKTFGFVTNGIASFWTIAAAGARDAGEKYGVEVRIEMPIQGVEGQNAIIEDLLASAVDGIAVSPIDAKRQAELLNRVGEKTLYITHDVDAPKTNRICHIGVDNYAAGRLAGKLVKEAIPGGGDVMLFVGALHLESAKLRRQGIIDELLDRAKVPGRYDGPKAVLKGDKYSIIGTGVDGFDFRQAKALPVQAIVDHPNIQCMVGLFAYNPPLIRKAVEDAGKLKKIKIVAFDEDFQTLDAIERGEMAATIVQDPYQYGFKSIETLYQLSKQDKSAIPKSKFIEVPARMIRRVKVGPFRETLENILNAAKQDGPLGP